MAGEGRYVTAPLIRRDDLGAGYHVLWFGLDPPIAAEAGQFAMLRSSSWGTAPLLPRPMSLLGGGREPSVLIKVVGEGTAKMASCPIGETWHLLAPLGRPWALPGEGETAVLVAGGVGIAPLVYLAEQLQGHEVLSLYGGRTARDLPLAERLERASTMSISTEDGSRGTRGRVTVLLEELLRKGPVRPKIYTCGPHAMMAAVARIAAEHGVPCQASLEAPMGCGYGVCLGCPVTKKAGGFLYTCVDGPCVDAAAVDWTRGVF